MALELLKIDALGLHGINSDVAPWDLPINQINGGYNFRCLAEKLQSVNAYEPWSTPGTSFNAGHLLYVGSLTSGYWLLCGRSAVYIFDGTTWTDISNTLGYGSIGADQELLWNSCLLGRIPIINNIQHYPEYWSPQFTTQPMQFLKFDAANTWQAKSYRCKVMRAHKNYLFALNMTEVGTEFPNVYRWSHPADINGLPFTWDETDTSAVAGRAQIGGNLGDIVDGLSLRDSFCIYSERGINILDPTLDEFVWNRRELSSTVGLIAPELVAEVKGTHFLLVDDDIVTNDGNTINSIAHKKIRKRISANVNDQTFDRSFLVRNTSKKEIWFCVPESGSNYPNVAYVYNWKDGAWSIRDLPTNIARAAYGPQSVAPTTYATVMGTYATTTLTYGSQTGSPLNDSVIAIDTSDSSLKILDPPSSGGTNDTNCRIERTNLIIGDIRESKTVLRIYPKLDSGSPVSVQIGSQEFPGGPVTWSSAMTFNPGVDRKLDVRSTGKLHAWRIESITNGYLECSGMVFEFARSGMR